LPLSIEAREEVEELQHVTGHLNPGSDANDSWCCVWGASEFRANNFYKHCFSEMQVDTAFTWIWSSCCTMQWKVFLWLILADHLNTRNMLRRRHYKIANDDYGCLFCNDPPEECIVHVFFSCPFSIASWNTLGISWPQSECRFQLIHAGRAASNKPMFMEVFAVVAWGIWKERNDKHFRGVPPSHGSWLAKFKKDFVLLKHRSKQKLVPFVLSFVQSL
jgi:hypothetical protein